MNKPNPGNRKRPVCLAKLLPALSLSFLCFAGFPHQAVAADAPVEPERLEQLAPAESLKIQASEPNQEADPEQLAPAELSETQAPDSNIASESSPGTAPEPNAVSGTNPNTASAPGPESIRQPGPVGPSETPNEQSEPVATETPSGTNTATQPFSYQHDPRNNPRAMEDIKEDAAAVYGFSPRPDGSLKNFVDYDWTDPVLLAEAQRQRIEYHEGFAELDYLLKEMKGAGASTEDIARAVSNKRNEMRLAAYKDDPEGLAKAKQRNLEEYGNENGGTPEFFYEKYGSWEKVIEKSFSVNSGMDAITGLYDVYYDLYVASGQVPPDPAPVDPAAPVIPTDPVEPAAPSPSSVPTSPALVAASSRSEALPATADASQTLLATTALSAAAALALFARRRFDEQDLAA